MPASRWDWLQGRRWSAAASCGAEGNDVPPYVYALMVHGVIGALDVFVNHEWLAKLPSRPACAGEERLHSAREGVFAALFASLAWCERHGDWPAQGAPMTKAARRRPPCYRSTNDQNS